jgi:hypothetical protein
VQDGRLQGFMQRCVELADAMRAQSRLGPKGELGSFISIDLPLSDEPEPQLLRRAHA